MNLNAAGELGGLIQKWLNVNSVRSQRMLATKSQVGLATINRLVSGSSQDKSITLDISLRLLPVICKKDEMMSYLERHLPKQADILKRAYAEKETKDPTYITNDMSKYLRDPIGFKVITLASNHCGTRREDIKRFLGEYGEKIVDDLISEGILYEDELGIIRNFLQEWGSLDTETIAAELNHCGQQLLRKKSGIISVQSEALNEEGVSELKELITSTLQKIIEIKNSDKYRGNIPVCFALVQTIID